MRITSILTAFAVVLIFGSAVPQSAEAGWNRDRAPSGWGQTRTVKHYVYYPRYRHRYKVHPHTDPYAYHYEPRGYYTKSSSRYWKPADKVNRHTRGHRHSRRRAKHHRFKYKAAWGHKHSRRRHRR